MPLDESRFHALADVLLRRLAEEVERQLDDEAEADLEGAVLTITLADGRQIVVNKHAANREIWLASPLSGAAHFGWDEASGEWRSTRDRASTLAAMLAEDLGRASGRTVAL